MGAHEIVADTSSPNSLFPPELWIVVQDHVQQRIVGLPSPIVLDEPELRNLFMNTLTRDRGAKSTSV
jgi:hypothetical protein